MFSELLKPGLQTTAISVGMKDCSRFRFGIDELSLLYHRNEDDDVVLDVLAVVTLAMSQQLTLELLLAFVLLFAILDSLCILLSFLDALCFFCIDCVVFAPATNETIDLGPLFLHCFEEGRLFRKVP